MNVEVSLAPFNPTSETGQQVALDLLQLTSTDVLFDLGCGDARFLVKAAQSVEGLHCIGIEYDENFVTRAIKSKYFSHIK
jgi:tRNA G46 methylase TrmB